MSPSIWCCLLMVTSLYTLSWSWLTHPKNSPVDIQSNLSDSVPSYFARERRKRGVPTAAVKLYQLGKAAVAHILKETKEIPSNDEAIRKFVKVGDLDSALKDFHDVNPTYIWNYRRYDGAEMFQGRAGDRLIRVNSRGEKGFPTITIIDFKKAKVDWYQQPHRDPYGHVTGKPIDRIIYKKTLTEN